MVKPRNQGDMLAALESYVGSDTFTGPGDELLRRLRLIAPVLSAGITGDSIAGAVRAKRNLASHDFRITAEEIETASPRQLNKFQRTKQ